MGTYMVQMNGGGVRRGITMDIYLLFTIFVEITNRRLNVIRSKVTFWANLVFDEIPKYGSIRI